MNREACPGCGAIVVDGDEHVNRCEYSGHDADQLEDRKRSWDRQAAIGAHRESEGI